MFVRQIFFKKSINKKKKVDSNQSKFTYQTRSLIHETKIPNRKQIEINNEF
jgi:hypothetical protein